jgi:hypothetical protein
MENERFNVPVRKVLVEQRKEYRGNTRCTRDVRTS